MPAIATSAVVLEVYRGIDFPSDWNTGNATITVDMARERLMSVIVLLDANKQPLATCWQVEGQEEQFIRIRFDSGEEDDLLDSLNTDLSAQSTKLGDPDLFATLLWEPGCLRPNQAIYVLRYVSVRGYLRQVWNLSTSEMTSKASDLLLIKHQTSRGLALAVPENLEEMRADTGEGAIEEFVILPVYHSMPQLKDEESQTRRILAWALLVLLVTLVLGAFATGLFESRS